MRFHNVHGANVLVDEGGKRATRLASFCDAITFSAKPVAVGSRLSLQLTSNESWTGALRLGLTSHDPAAVVVGSSGSAATGGATALPRFSCPDLASKQGYWIRPLPERWIARCSKLTFYVNAQGHFQLFVDNEYKGALFSGLPVKERLWLIIDLYGISVSAKFVAPCSSTPVEVVARGPDAVRAYKQACAEGSVPLYRARLYIIGCPGAGKSSLKRALLNAGGTEGADGAERSVVDAVHCCRTSEKGDGAPWTALPTELLSRAPEDVDQNWVEPDVGHISDAEYHHAVALNVVREMTLQQRKRQHQEDKRRLLGSTRSSVKGQGGVLRHRNNNVRHGGSSDGSAGGGGHGVNARSTSVKSSHPKEALSAASSWEGMPQDLPAEVVVLVERLLKEAESKQDLDARETEKGPRLTSSAGTAAAIGSTTAQATSSQVTFMIWDFDGLPRHFLTHQAFYSSHGIYLLLFDLTRDLNEPIHVPDQTRSMEDAGSPVSTIDYVHQWLTSIHVSAARTHQDGDYGAAKDVEDVDTSQLLPTVILVGTHRSQLRGNAQARNNTISEKFTQLRETLRNKAYGRHVLPMYFAVDCCLDPSTQASDPGGGDYCGGDPEEALEALRRKVEHVAARMDSVGHEVPLRWLAFERALARLLENGVYFASLYQLEEIGRQEGIESEDGFHSVVHFLHQQGKLVCFGCQHRGTGVGALDSRWDGIVILRPQWFLDALYKLIGLAPQKQTCWEDVPKGRKEPASYRISYKQLRTLWSNSTDQLETLVAVLSSLDVLVAHYERLPSELSLIDDDEAFCVVPWLATSLQTRSMALGNSPSSDALVFFIDFAGLLPVGFFTRLVVRLLRWCDWREASFITGFATIPLDRDNDLLLKLHQTSPSQNRGRIQVVIQRTNTMENWMGGIPQPSICEKVVHLIEAEIEALRELWYNRLCFKCFVTCPCKSIPCAQHSSKDCQEQACLHFLPLDECLHRKVVYCDYRRVQTEFVRRHFPYASFHGMRGYSAGMRRASSATAVWDADQPPLGFSAFGWEERFGQCAWEEPPWLRDAARLLESGNTGRDWLALAKRLGYTDKELSRFVEETSPGVALLRDWRESNGATRYCIDVLISCLHQISRQDVARMIQDELEPESLAPPVFISYQWDAQEVVLNIRQHLEFSGFPCWMDVGQVGGGDSLYGKIYEGISRAKVVLCCLTPRYASSSSCARELSLADVLHKPIVPVMVEPTPWPPPGPLAVVLSALVYVDLCGIGGHGGSGRRADWEMRFQEIVGRVAQFLAPPTSAPRPHSNKHRASLAPLLTAHAASAAAATATSGNNAASTGGLAARTATPSPRASFSQANAARNEDERELQSSASVPMDDDRESDASNPGSPQSWDRPNRMINRVVRCSICTII
ncbi:hypothetical protein V5799_033566 [Amblyomma americanum]|uniref:Uncharacterized protein n=1 Tax=Amblyomma americanum TaxID=6943 RepID=A0AAQ4DMY3_AMBAM